uniref:Uncharacterized protein n=1 Tax=Candidatus Kentrum sp. TUN TaxID=2126343 RepID=A0A451AC57_9GAMM|nr:MAG: hypothetical protein BECKTUN1418F_GA0071002_10959 [Candidatus Kentron sp. TUN]VFK60408.1 MAG: hypothetical protein BECKTUN1418D_GA0071000_11233 [Candidatus Kentron sp. TUN]VFK63617.1 MAG: hypothetical protein BECKTUN1418E_GA0071001_10925 [Candidatus Kentron sp. TUN]
MKNKHSNKKAQSRKRDDALGVRGLLRHQIIEDCINTVIELADILVSKRPLPLQAHVSLEEAVSRR